jgi:hypothetical protein
LASLKIFGGDLISKLTPKAEDAGFVQCLMHSCNQPRNFLSMLLPDNYEVRIK